MSRRHALQHWQSLASRDTEVKQQAQVLFVKVRRGTRSSVEARSYLTDRELPVMAAEIHLLESYPLAYGTVPQDLAEYEAVVKELAAAGEAE